MNDELLRILKQLNELQASILQVMNRHGQIPEEALPSEVEEVPEYETPAPDTRIAWSGGVPPAIQEEFEATYGVKYQSDVPGVAYRKDA